MKIGIQQTALGKSSLAKCFAHAKHLGAEGIGLCYCTPEDVQCLGNSRHGSKVRSLVERFGIPVTGLHLQFLCEEQSLIGTQPTVVRSQDMIRRAISTAFELKSPDVIIPFFGRNRIEFPKELDTAVAVMSELAATAEDCGVVLAIKSSLHLSQLQHFLVEGGNDFVKICFDTGEVTACRHNPVSMLLGLGVSSIAQVYIKDVSLVNGCSPNFSVSLGRGNVRFSGVANALYKLKYNGWLVLDTLSGDDNDDVISAQINYVRNTFCSNSLLDDIQTEKVISL